MERRPFGTTELEITAVGVGTAPIGSGRDWPVFWGPQDEPESVAAIKRALELGVNWIDTAPFYGWGRAEEIVGRALRGVHDDVLVFSKCGTARREWITDEPSAGKHSRGCRGEPPAPAARATRPLADPRRRQVDPD